MMKNASTPFSNAPASTTTVSQTIPSNVIVDKLLRNLWQIKPWPWSKRNIPSAVRKWRGEDHSYRLVHFHEVSSKCFRRALLFFKRFELHYVLPWLRMADVAGSPPNFKLWFSFTFPPLSTMAPGKSGSGNGFQPMGLSDPVFRGVVRMGFRVSQKQILQCSKWTLSFRSRKAHAFFITESNSRSKKGIAGNPYRQWCLCHGKNRQWKDLCISYTNPGEIVGKSAECTSTEVSSSCVVANARTVTADPQSHEQVGSFLWY